MVFLDDTNNVSLYPTILTPGEFDTYSSLSQTSAIEEAGIQTSANIFADDWTTGRESSYTVGQTTDLLAEGNFESVSPVTVQVHNYDQLAYPQHYWPITDRYAQSHGSDIVGHENASASTVTLEAATITPTPNNNEYLLASTFEESSAHRSRIVPFGWWGENEGGRFTRTSYENTRPSHQPGAGSTRTGLVPAERFEPYGTHHARSNEYNTEAGPSTLVRSPTPYMAPPTAHPPEGTESEATADAATDQPRSEEDTAPRQTAKRLRGPGQPHNWRVRYQGNIHRLCTWAKGWKTLKKHPSHETALGIALEVIEMIRVPVYAAPRLIKCTGKRTAQGKKAPDAEHKRRKGTRKLNRELSRYYELAPKQAEWGCPDLLSKVLSDVEGLQNCHPPKSRLRQRAP